MKQITISLDESVADSLASRIDDTMPTLKHVARRVLTLNAEQWDEDTGCRRRPCQCGNLKRWAENLAVPIVFDAKTNEFHFKFRTEQCDGELIIYHCPFCGGAAPRSIRHSLFAIIPDSEARRLNTLFAEVKTFDEAEQKFGKPDHDFPNGVSIDKLDKDGETPTTQVYRCVVYGSLSETVDVRLTDYHGDRVDIYFQGKSLARD